MFINYLEPSDGHGLDVVLHWIGPGWYGPIQEMGVIHEYPIYGYDKDGFSEDGEARVWDEQRGLGTPHWLDSVKDYSGYEKTEVCPNCGSAEIETEDYLNACANAACKLNGVHTYHLGCGSQWREICANCGVVLYDSAEDEIENAKWREVEYICSQCKVEGIQPGHFACGLTHRIYRRVSTRRQH